jgi:hypothetical protein
MKFCIRNSDEAPRKFLTPSSICHTSDTAILLIFGHGLPGDRVAATGGLLEDAPLELLGHLRQLVSRLVHRGIDGLRHPGVCRSALAETTGQTTGRTPIFPIFQFDRSASWPLAAGKTAARVGGWLLLLNVPSGADDDCVVFVVYYNLCCISLLFSNFWKLGWNLLS